MLKLTVKPGEYLQIGEDIKVVITGGSAGNIRILVDAPPQMNIARSKVLEKYGDRNGQPCEVKKYWKENEFPKTARDKSKMVMADNQ